MFRDIKELAESDIKEAPLLALQKRKRLLIQAGLLRDRREKEMDSFLNPFREKLKRIDAEGLLTEIKNDVWGCGKIVSDPGGFVVSVEEKKSRIPGGEPTFVSVETRFNGWPSVSLRFKSPWLEYRREYDHQLKSGSVDSSLIITAGEYLGRKGVLIARENTTWITGVWGNPNPKIMNGGEGTDLFTSQSPDYQKILSGFSILDMAGVKLTNPEYLGVDPTPIGHGCHLFIGFPTFRPKELIVNILKGIVYEDVYQKQLPGEIYSRALEVTKQSLV